MNRLYSVRMNLGFLNNKDTEEALNKRKEYIQGLQDIENEIRELSHDLKRNTLSSNNNFVDLIKSLTDDSNALGLTNFTFQCDDAPIWNQISNIKKVNIYRIIQESFLNVHKHAEADHCCLTLIFSSSDGFSIIIKDDGKGFDTNLHFTGIGMQNIQERISVLSGKLSIDSSEGEGTRICITFS